MENRRILVLGTTGFIGRNVVETLSKRDGLEVTGVYNHRPPFEHPGMTWLKAGTKAATGAKPGKHPKGAWVTAVRAAGLANPKTASKIGKGKSTINKLARRLKKWW